MEDVFQKLIRDIKTCHSIENGKPKNGPISKSKKTNDGGESHITDTLSTIKSTVEYCDHARKCTSDECEVDTSDQRISKMARFTDEMALKPFQHFLQYVPRLVNVVTLAEAFPVPGSGLKLPLDLSFIASRCTGAYFAPKRFSAVQLAYTNPRARVLIFRKCRTLEFGIIGLVLQGLT
tara:strand:- start:368 stop:901 length:534 start_codon:yes stop_codon:yes gene_type:complete